MITKKIRIIIGISLILWVFITILNIDNETYTEIDGVKYAIFVDGQSSSTFPTGDYTAEVDCSNADGYWDSLHQKLIVKNIIGDVRCYVEFTSLTNNDYLNNYVISLENDDNQGEGTVIHETIDEYATAYSSYTTSSMTYVASNNNYLLDESNNEYTVPAEVVTSYHKFYPQSDGVYKMCYSIPSSAYTSNTSSYMNFIAYNKKNTTSSNSQYITYIYSNYNSGATKTGCVYLGKLVTTDYIYITTKYYDQSSIIYFQKADESTTDAGYRYEGSNPNNYVLFNNNLWRIIGVFGEESHGQDDKLLVKIIQNDTIGALSWDTHQLGSATNREYMGISNWDNATLKALLNNSYYNHTNASTDCWRYYGDPSYGAVSVTGKCIYENSGIQDEYHGMIEDVSWYLGGATYYTPTSIYAANGYLLERSGPACKIDNRPGISTGYIGLMYMSDYLYGVKASDCARTTTSTSYNNSNCAAKNWLYRGNKEWTITTSSSCTSQYNPGFFILENGSMSADPNTPVGYGFLVRPVLYLTESVYRVSGTGTINDPYILGLSND